MTRKRYYDGADWPCINVKSYGYGAFDAEDIQDKYHCDAQTARAIMDNLWEEGCFLFWGNVEEKVRQLFEEDARPVQFGRSGGWLSVSTLRNMTELKDYEDNVDDPEEAQKMYEADTKALAELEAYCRAEIRAMEKLDYWADYIKDNKLGAEA